MDKVIFRKIGGRIIPIKQGKNLSKFLTNQEASDHFMQKGLQDMLKNDVKQSGANIHERANLQHIANGMHRLKDGKFKMAADRIKKFLKENRK